MDLLESQALPPLVLEPIFKEKVWGGRRLERFGKTLPPRSRIGESWEIADLDRTAPSGGGGEPAHSRVARGPLSGRTLREILAAAPERLLGPQRTAPEGGFPWLVKYLDAAEHLSVQVHPSPEYASSHPGAALKHECWTVLHAAPGARLYIGLEEGVGREDLRRALETSEVVALLRQVPAVPGECHLLPSGLVHALGAGVVVAEVQTPSDTTYRLYDWTREYRRPERELHVETALEALTLDPPPPPRRLRGENTLLARTSSFRLLGWTLAPGAHRSLPETEGCLALLVVGGSASIRGAWPHVEPLRLGETAVVPWESVPGARLEAGPGGATVLVVTPEG